MAGQESTPLIYQSAENQPAQAPAPSGGGGGGGGMSALPPELMQQLQSVMKGQMSGAQSISHVPQPQVNPKFAAPTMKETAMSFIPIIGEALQKQVQAKKQAEVNKYASLWKQLDDANTWAQQQAGGDKDKFKQFFENSLAYKTIMSQDPKAQKMWKEMTKVLQAPWLEDGEQSPAVHGYKRHMQLKDAQQQMDKVGQMQQQFKEYMAQQPQQAGDPKGANETARSMVDVQNAETSKMRATMEKYDIKQQGNGDWIGIDKTHPEKSAVPIKTADGKAVTGQVKSQALIGRPALVNGVPMGVVGRDANGVPKVVKPGDPEWNADYDKTFKGAMAAYAVGEHMKTNRLTSYAWSRAQAFSHFNLKDVLDTRTGNIAEVPVSEIVKAPEGTYVMGNQADKLTAMYNTFNEIETSFRGMEQSIGKIGPIDAKVSAQLSAALKEPDAKSATQIFINTLAKGTLTPEQEAFVIWRADAVESAQMMRATGASARSSQDIRDAVVAMLPGAGPDQNYMKNQMKALWAMYGSLRKGMPGMGKLGTTGITGNAGDDINGALDKLFGPQKKKQ